MQFQLLVPDFLPVSLVSIKCRENGEKNNKAFKHHHWLSGWKDGTGIVMHYELVYMKTNQIPAAGMRL